MEVIVADFSNPDLNRMLTEARTALESMRRGGPDASTGLPSTGLASTGLPSTEAKPIEGVGEAADGKVKATAISGGRLRGVELDPRMMRMASKELGEHVVSAVNAALDDLRAKATEAAAAESVDTAGLGERIDEIQTQSERQMELITQTLNDTIAKIAGTHR